MVDEFRSNGGHVVGWERQPLLLLHHRGARTGTWRVNPLARQDLATGWAVFGSKGGAPTDPDWYRNLVANPDARVEVGDSTFGVRARVATGEEGERIWEEQKRRNPAFAAYEERTRRQIPVVILEPAGGSGSTPGTS